ncbi:VOC family protein [Ramlibacter terrae]|uniref:VOC family protein n=1 Tax=Ramlibacter terrae TaxID=2732511 RepID=A0ABX6P5R6_9BURK|nr:VOC family protein [Ramlibacter terrae]
MAPGPGGEHPLMGTHNRLLRIATVDYPRAYPEIIAIQPGKQPERGRRWFDLDDEALRDALRHRGPRLVHFVANVSDVRQAAESLQALGIDRGDVVSASRMTPRGLLEWQITIRADGQRLFDGVMPTLIEWGATHPAAGMGESGITLQALVLRHPQAATVRAAQAAIDLQGVGVKEGPAGLCAVLDTPRGRVKLESAAA